MEPLDTDLEYVRSGQRPAKPGSRYNVMLIIPILGFLLVLVLIGAAVFQWDLSELIDSLHRTLHDPIFRNHWHALLGRRSQNWRRIIPNNKKRWTYKWRI